MPDDLYDHDALAWSERQADLLRRHRAGERVNGIDWAHVIEEVEDVGLSQLNAVRANLGLILLHLLTLHLWPESPACQHWRGEILAFRTRARTRFSPSMRQRIDLGALYGDAARDISDLDHGTPSLRTPPALCPVTLDQVLTAPGQDLEAAFRDAGG